MKFLVLALFVALAAAAPAPDAHGEPVELIVNGVPEGQALELGNVVDIKLKEHQDGVLASSNDLLHPLTASGIAEAEAAAAAEVAQPEIIPSPVQIVDNVEAQPMPEVAIVPETEAIPDVIAIMPIPGSEVNEPIPDNIAIMPIPGSEVNEPIPDNIAVIPIPGSEVYEAVPDIIAIMPIPETEGPAVEEVAPIELLPPKPPMVIIEAEVAPSPVVVPESLPEPAPQLQDGEVFNNGLVQVQLNGTEDTGMLSTIQSWFSMVVNYISNGIQTTQQIV